MAFSLDSLLESVIPAIISGGGTAVSTILAFVRDIKRRLDELEKRVGSMEGKAGLVYSMHVAEELLKKLKEDWDDRNQVRGRLPSYSGVDPNNLGPDSGVLSKLREFDHRLKDMEENVERLEGKFRKYVSEDEFEKADRDRASEIATVRTTLAEVRGLLQGLQSALGLIGNNKDRR